MGLVSGGTWSRPLVDRDRHRASGFGWGARVAGSVSLARSILFDVTGTESGDGLAITFAGDVLAQLPDDAFTLAEHEVRDWLQDQYVRRMGPHELVEHLGAVALAQPEEEAEMLRGLVDRCGTARSLVN